MPLVDMLGPLQASSSVAVTFDADSAGASSEVGRLQGHYFQYFHLLPTLFNYVTQFCLT